MRMMLKVSIPTEKGNQAITDGSLPQVLQATLDALKPEAAYHLTYEGERTSLLFFDLADPSEIPPIAERLFQGLGAKLNFYPVMNTDDLKKGVAAAMAQAQPSR